MPERERGVRSALAVRQAPTYASPPCCPRHSRPIRTLSLALRACIPDPTRLVSATKTRRRGASRFREAPIPARSASEGVRAAFAVRQAPTH